MHWTAGGELPIAVMRSAWNDPWATWVAVKGGTPNGSHAHMDIGSFVLEAGGVRWAVDPGTERYDLMRAAGIDMWNYTQESTRWTTFRVGPDGHNILRINGAMQQVDGKATIHSFALDNGDVGDNVDLSSVYRGQVERMNRQVTLHPDRSATITDEWLCGPHPVEVSWQWLTQATVSSMESGLLLQQQEQTLTLTVSGKADTAVSIEDVSSPVSAQDSPNPGLTRIVIRQTTNPQSAGKLVVHVKLGADPA